MSPVPAHQLCPDCRSAKRALAMGLPGYGCLCIPCFNKRMEAARKKKKPRRQTVADPQKREYTWGERLSWTPEQQCAHGYCIETNCERCGNALDRLDDINEL